MKEQHEVIYTWQDHQDMHECHFATFTHLDDANAYLLVLIEKDKDKHTYLPTNSGGEFLVRPVMTRKEILQEHLTAMNNARIELLGEIGILRPLTEHIPASDICNRMFMIFKSNGR